MEASAVITPTRVFNLYIYMGNSARDYGYVHFAVIELFKKKIYFYINWSVNRNVTAQLSHTCSSSRDRAGAII